MKLILSTQDVEDKLRLVLKQDGIEVSNLCWGTNQEGDTEAIIEFSTVPAEAAQKNPVLIELENINKNLVALFGRVDEVTLYYTENATSAPRNNGEPARPKRKRKQKVASAQDDVKESEEPTSIKITDPATGKVTQRRLGPNESYNHPG